MDAPFASPFFTSWTLRPEMVLGLLLTLFIYLRGWWRLSRILPERFPVWRLLCFTAGLVTLFIALCSPLDAFAGFLLQAHMVQHLLLTMVAPPLLWAGCPYLPMLRGLPKSWVREGLAPLINWPALQRVVHTLTSLGVVLVFFLLVNVLWHVPVFYEAALKSRGIHELEHAMFFGSSMLFWWHVVLPWPARSRGSRWLMIPYLLLADLQNTALAAFLTFCDRVLYPTYQNAPNISGLSPMEDQAGAGALMWVAGSAFFLLPAGLIARGCLVPKRKNLPEQPLEPWIQFPGWMKPRKLRTGKPISFFLSKWSLALQRRTLLRRSLQCSMLLLAGLVVLDGWLGPQVSPLNLAGVLPWTHWRGFVVLALLIAGNLFCMSCPFTLARDAGRKFFNLGWQWPRRFRSKWIAVALLIFYFWAYEAYALWDRPAWTASLIVAYFAAAMLVDGIFKGASFCKYLCPIGQFHFTQSLISPLEVKVREPAICEGCKTQDCLRGNATHRGCELELFQPTKQGNMDCTFCLECVAACPYENVSLQAVTPAADLWLDKARASLGRLSKRIDVTALVLVLVFAAFFNAVGMLKPVLAWEDLLSEGDAGARLGLLAVGAVLSLILIPCLSTVLCSWIGIKWSGLSSWPLRQVLASFALGLVPLGFSLWLAHFSFHLLTGWGSPLEIFSRFTGTSDTAWLPPFWVMDRLIPMELICLDGGLLVSIWACWKISGNFSNATGARLRLAMPWWILCALLFATGVWIFFQPMEMRGTFLQS